MTESKVPRLTHNDVEIRAAQATDRDIIDYIASQTWDGHDYLPHVFEKWLNDPDGAFNIMIYQGQVVALSKLSKFGEEEWWMEGLRVHPDFQGRGLARIMHHYLVGQARRIGEGIVRFSTSGRNEAIVKLAAETGFELVGSFVVYEGSAKAEAPGKWWQLQGDEIETLEEWLDNSAYFHDVTRSFEESWKWQIVDTDLLQRLIAEKRIYGWSSAAEGDLQGVVVINALHQRHDEELVGLSLAFVDAEPDYRPLIWQVAQAIGGEEKADVVRIKLLDLEPYREAVVSAGWETRDSHPVLFSRPLTMVDESQVKYTELPSLES